MAAHNKYAEIHEYKSGKFQGQFHFKLFGRNSRMVGGSENQKYNRKSDCKKTLEELFPDWKIVDKTVDKRKKLQSRKTKSR